METFLALSAVAAGASWICYFRALQLGEAAKVAPIDKLSVAFAIVLGIVVLGEPLTWRVALGGGLRARLDSSGQWRLLAGGRGGVGNSSQATYGRYSVQLGIEWVHQ